MTSSHDVEDLSIRQRPASLLSRESVPAGQGCQSPGRGTLVTYKLVTYNAARHLQPLLLAREFPRGYGDPRRLWPAGTLWREFSSGGPHLGGVGDLGEDLRGLRDPAQVPDSEQGQDQQQRRPGERDDRADPDDLAYLPEPVGVEQHAPQGRALEHRRHLASQLGVGRGSHRLGRQLAVGKPPPDLAQW